MMKIQVRTLILSAGLFVLPGLLQAQPTAHYVPGVEGIKAATLPPPGLYLRDYNVAYTSTRANNADGVSAGPPNFDVFTYANVPRLVWITDHKFLGGFVGVDSLLPLVYQSVTAGGFDSNTIGVGDFFAEATLSWHVEKFDFSIGSGAWAPTGDSAAPPTTRAGLGYWSPMFTAGATGYLDSEKTWAISALSRYEINTEQSDTGITPGDAYTLEWGVSKTVNKTIDLGAVGYYQQQVNEDSGIGAGLARDRVAAVGPEINVLFPGQMLFASFRYLYEFTAVNRAQGHTFAFTLTKRF